MIRRKSQKENFKKESENERKSHMKEKLMAIIQKSPERANSMLKLLSKMKDGRSVLENKQ